MKYILIYYIAMRGVAITSGAVEFNTYAACEAAGIELVSKPKAGIAANWICKEKG